MNSLIPSDLLKEKRLCGRVSRVDGGPGGGPRVSAGLWFCLGSLRGPRAPLPPPAPALSAQGWGLALRAPLSLSLYLEPTAAVEPAFRINHEQGAQGHRKRRAGTSPRGRESTEDPEATGLTPRGHPDPLPLRNGFTPRGAGERPLASPPDHRVSAPPHPSLRKEQPGLSRWVVGGGGGRPPPGEPVNEGL